MDSRSEPLFCTVEISGPLMKDYGDIKPFIKANLIPDEAGRKKRNVNNNGNDKNNNCYKSDFYITFEELDFNFVVAPLGFNPYICLGKCTDWLSSRWSLYHLVKTIFFKKFPDKREQSKWKPCCSIAILNDLVIIYIPNNSTDASTEDTNIDNCTNTKSNTDNTNDTYGFTHHTIPNIIIDSCRCW
ncbi:TGF_BETA_2 domain-containing protein [Caerostris darwini]|uniref:TGF_BETA_2 domain-containing protein n=1 Tax=Caerostris darwini TaxID=1538125 RepID=A0AAV4T8I5_9ARAC|nr:TGF_BETA_2 domain-containing protein [Caerostris darwini]